MKVGIVNMYSNKNSTKYLVQALNILHIDYDLHSIKNKNLVNSIKNSSIQLWIFSGSNHNVLESSIQVPMEIFNLKQKKFLLICYSMESVLHQLNFPITMSKKVARELFCLENQVLWRNHFGSIPASAFDKIKEPHLIQSYKGVAMTALYKNATMVQWHPELTSDGILFLFHWIFS